MDHQHDRREHSAPMRHLIAEQVKNSAPGSDDGSV
jgi:hypothetical protein